MVILAVYLKKVKILSFIIFMYNMPTTEVIGVVNSLDKDKILDFKTSCFFFVTFPFPKELLYSCCFQVKWP